MKLRNILIAAATMGVMFASADRTSIVGYTAGDYDDMNYYPHLASKYNVANTSGDDFGLVWSEGGTTWAFSAGYAYDMSSPILDDDGEESGVKPLAIACLILAIIALAIEGFTTDKLAEANSPNAAVSLLDIPNNDYNRAFKFEDGENEMSFKFLRYSPDTKQDPPSNIFDMGVDENLPIKDYETFKNEQN